MISEYSPTNKAISWLGCERVFSVPVLVSIHDVMPHTLPDVLDLLMLLQRLHIRPVTLLVVPNAGWSVPDLERLRGLQQHGCYLAGHGWTHQDARENIHWHERLIFRDVAEHLSYDVEEIAEIISVCYQWFQEMEFDSPQLYVPPGWILGDISRKKLEELPFRMYETLTGVYDTQTGRFIRLPFVGYWVDTHAKSEFRRMMNSVNLFLASRLNLPLRIALHPSVLKSEFVPDVQRLFKRSPCCLSYSDLARLS